MEIKTVIYIVLSIFGTCAAGFFFLSIWIRSLGKEIGDIKVNMKERVSYKWFEDVFKKELKDDLDKLEKGLVDSSNLVAKEVHKLTEAVIGTVETKGMLTKVHEHDDRIEKVENRCSKHLDRE